MIGRPYSLVSIDYRPPITDHRLLLNRVAVGIDHRRLTTPHHFLDDGTKPGISRFGFCIQLPSNLHFYRDYGVNFH